MKKIIQCDFLFLLLLLLHCLTVQFTYEENYRPLSPFKWDNMHTYVSSSLCHLHQRRWHSSWTYMCSPFSIDGTAKGLLSIWWIWSQQWWNSDSFRLGKVLTFADAFSTEKKLQWYNGHLLHKDTAVSWENSNIEEQWPVPRVTTYSENFGTVKKPCLCCRSWFQLK